MSVKEFGSESIEIFDPWEPTEIGYEVHEADGAVLCSHASHRSAKAIALDCAQPKLFKNRGKSKDPTISGTAYASTDRTVYITNYHNVRPFKASTEHVEKFMEALWHASACGILHGACLANISWGASEVNAKPGTQYYDVYSRFDISFHALSPYNGTTIYIGAVNVGSARVRLASQAKVEDALRACDLYAKNTKTRDISVS